MINMTRRLREIVHVATPRLLTIPETQAVEKPDAEKWSLKEILGHLVDSAANNHQRIVRMQESEDIGVFTYAQRYWVDAQDYQAEPWHEIVEFWCRYNNHLAHIIACVDPVALCHVCDMGYGSPASLAFVIEDYLRHVEHHLGQIFVDADHGERKKWVSRDPGAGVTPL